MIKQFAPSEICLKCRSCCRFREADSVWSPCLLEEEIQEFIDKDIPHTRVSIAINHRLCLLPQASGEGFICPFLNEADNHCKVYACRPFECQLYPFLLNMRAGKVLLTIDLNCPYASEKIDSPEMRDYIRYLAAYLNEKKQLKLLKDNPQIIQAYEEVRAVAELDLGK
ncbi:MAG: YkgJ family cysteine cluster protein [Candidatus Omnitrophica bacterium]|jgi:Fe-S-cluster containining protein|nr:YkgJ family cysteine cluster protein [Candidatus Omnitrophota bacterium]